MSRTVEELLREGPSDPDVDALWAAEIERRVADIDSGRETSIPWEEARQRMLERLHAR